MFKKEPKYDPMTMAFINLDGKQHPEAYETGIERGFSTLGTILKILICIPFLPIIVPIKVFKAMLGD